jgi:RNA 2',3'-cyclic 3'-phosphodiesterase
MHCSALSDLPPTIRAFVAISIPESRIAALREVQDSLRTQFEDVSWTRPEAMHLTLHFFGNVLSENLDKIRVALADCASRFSPFELSLRGVGSFGNRVIWAGLDGDCQTLKALANEVRDAVSALGAHQEDREFNGHVTLGRFRRPGRGVGAKLRRFEGLEFGRWRVDHLELIRSELSSNGSRYTVLASEKLGKTAAVTEG